MPSDAHSNAGGWYRSRTSIIVSMQAVILIFFVIRKHWEHLAGRWIYLLLLLCPLIHLFGHGGHGHHGKSEDSNG